MQKSSIFIPFLFIILSCSSDIEEKALIKIDNVFKAKSSNIMHGIVIAKSGKEISVTKLTLIFPTLNFQYKKQKITSIAALTFYNETLNLNYKSIDSISVSLKAMDNVYNKTYEIGEIRTANEFLNKIFSCVKNVQIGNIDTLYEMVDSTKILRSDLIQTKNLFSELKHSYGSITKIISTGFSYNHSQDTNEPILILWVELNNNKKVSFCTFYISLATQKIIYYNIDSKE